MLNAATVNGYSIVTYQRPLRATDEFDLPIISNATQAIAWAIGPLNQRNEVSYHSLYSKTTKLIQFGREPKWNCPLSENDMKMIDDGADEGDEIYDATPNQPINRVQTTSAQTTHRGNYAEIENDRRKQVAPTPARAPSVPRNKHWEIPPIQCYEPDDGVFYAQMGPTGGKQGYPAITGSNEQIYLCIILILHASIPITTSPCLRHSIPACKQHLSKLISNGFAFTYYLARSCWLGYFMVHQWFIDS